MSEQELFGENLTKEHGLEHVIRTRLLGIDPDEQDVRLDDDDWRAILAALDALKRIAEGNLGDEPWQANYARIKQVAAEALEQAGPSPQPEDRWMSDATTDDFSAPSLTMKETEMSEKIEGGYTPGDWRLDDDGWIVSESGDFAICLIDGSREAKDFAPEDKANADLIIAAPELLAAANLAMEGIEVLDLLVASIEKHGNYSVESTLGFLHQARCAKLRLSEAISKATGGAS